jgi:uncharacterized membrane protein YczE
MKKKIVEIPAATYHVSTHDTDFQLTKITVTEGYTDKVIAEFFIPTTSREKHGFVPHSVLDSRMKRDFNIKVGHWSCILSL